MKVMYDARAALAARMTEADIMVELQARVRKGTCVLPSDPDERVKAISKEILAILHESYKTHEVQA